MKYLTAAYARMPSPRIATSQILALTGKPENLNGNASWPEQVPAMLARLHLGQCSH